MHRSAVLDGTGVCVAVASSTANTRKACGYYLHEVGSNHLAL